MNELVKVIEKDNRQWVNARDLHEALGVKHKFADWVANRIEKYKFKELKDYVITLGESTGGRPNKEYHMTLRMASHITIADEGKIGEQLRDYFIKLEEAWNTPEIVIQRARQAGAVILTEESVKALEHLAAGMALSPFPGNVFNGIPASVERIYTENDEGGRVYLVAGVGKKKIRIILIYGPCGEFLQVAPVMLDKYELITQSVKDHLEREYMYTLGGWRHRERVEYDDFFRWKAGLIRKCINAKVLPDPKVMSASELEHLRRKQLTA